MSSVHIDQPTKVNQHPSKKENDNNKSRKQFNSSHKKHKYDDNRGGSGGGGCGGGVGTQISNSLNKFGRKRVLSNNGKFFLPYKRRKKEGVIIPPTKFLLGGNICDPLNLNSMQDEEVNRAMNAVTPKSSPLPTPKHKKEAIEVFPPNICDPLKLTCNDDEEYEKQLLSPLKRASKRRNRKRKRVCSSSVKNEVTSETVEDEKLQANIGQFTQVMECSTERSSSERIQPQDSEVEKDQNYSKDLQKDKNTNIGKVGNKFEREDKSRLRLKGLEEPKDKRLRKDTKDKIVSPVIPQPGAWKSRLQHRPNQDKKKKQQQMPNFRQKDARYQYGNYNRYYGYRNPGHEVDPRLTAFARRKELFLQKDILDIGCNIGHITLSVARDLGAKSVTGIDIDRVLINIARKNVKHYVNCVQSPASNEGGDRTSDSDASFFPMSMPINYGPIDIPGFTKHKQDKGFPYNITFVQGNYVLDDDSLLHTEQPRFDTILCLSITKWLHLNFGDAGLKQAFKRMYAQLRPNGVLVLEPQGWASYSKKKSLTERIYKNYNSIEFRPHNFTHYLLSSEVGFDKCEVISVPSHPSKGFQRPLHLFTKLGEQSNDDTNIVDRRQRRRSEQLREEERIKYERELFPKDPNKGSTSGISQRSEDLNKYEQLENVYVPGVTPYYDTQSMDNNEHQVHDRLCYIDMDVQGEKIEVESTDKASNVDGEMETVTDSVDKVWEYVTGTRQMEKVKDSAGKTCDDSKQMKETREEVKDNDDNVCDNKETIEVENSIDTSKNDKKTQDVETDYYQSYHYYSKKATEVEEAKDSGANKRHNKKMIQMEIVENSK